MFFELYQLIDCLRVLLLEREDAHLGKYVVAVATLHHGLGEQLSLELGELRLHEHLLFAEITLSLTFRLNLVPLFSVEDGLVGFDRHRIVFCFLPLLCLCGLL